MQLEQLSDRLTPSTVTFIGSTVVVTGDSAANVITVDPTPTGVAVTVDGTVNTYDGVTAVVVTGGRGDDKITNNSSVSLFADGGKGNDTLFGGTGINVIDAGDGKDVVYALLGSNTITAADGQADRIYTNPSAVVAPDSKDQVVTFFADGRVPNSGQAALVDGVLYLTPAAGGSSTVITEKGNTVTVVTTYAGTLVFDKGEVEAIAYFGGSGADYYQNDTKIEEAAYGAAGNDTLISGFGAFNLLKGSGGDDVLWARGKAADVSANGGADVIYLDTPKATVRIDAADVVVGGKKVVYAG